MDTRADEFVRSEFSDRSLRQLLEAPVTSLLGVSTAAADQLRAVGIQTIFDLGTSRLFGSANEILLGSVWTSGNVGLSEHVPGDLVDDGQRDVALVALSQSPLSALRIVSDATGQLLSGALGVSNIREFALWPPYRAARAIVSRTFGGTSDGEAVADPESPPELVPGARQLPTERIQYDILMLDKIWEPPSDDTTTDELTIDGGGLHVAGGWRSEVAPVTIARTPVDSGRALEGAGQLDLATLTVNSIGFTAPATGALLTYTQSWFPEGLALGQLLHSVALAPGESTRLAMIDWSRRSSATTTEGISETELLTSDLDRARSISEIVSAVATEAQQGFSSSFGGGFGTSVGTASGGAGSFDFGGGGAGSSGGGGGGGLPLKLAGGSGGSTGMGFGVGGAQSSGWTTGQRNLSANMAQNIMDRTHQASNSSRNRKATIVREANQSESERIGTRTVTNYNHMHALSIQYFETVQLYRVAVELAKVTACLFVPMKLLDFTRVGVVARYKRAIAAAGLSPAVRALQRAETDTLIVSAPSRRASWNLGALAAMFGESVGDPTDSALAFPLNFYPMSIDYSEDAPLSSFVLEFSNGSTTEIPVVTNQNALGKYHVDLLSGYGPTVDKAAPFWDIVSIRAKKQQGSEDWAGDLSLVFRMVSLQRDGFPKPQGGIASGFVIARVGVAARDASPVLLEMSRTVSGRDLRQHLLDNQLYYSQAIWRTLDSVTIGQILASFTFEGRPVLSIVDPLPLTVAANYLVFRKHLVKSAAAETAWSQWLVDHDISIGERNDDIVPLPSGGVFAEAVLGRFNSAEKLDITRFWNWQDSPIPITPTEIAAIQSGSRAQPEDLRPSQLGAPGLTIQLPPGEPDPQGLTAILQAIQNGNMFRDMSGMTATIGFAQTALTRAFDAARDAAAQAGENMKTAADIYKSAFGGGGATMPSGSTARPSSGTTRNASETGALINHGRTMDSRSGSNAGSNGGAPTGIGPGGTMANSQALTGQESAAFNSALGEGGQTAWGYTPVSGADPLRVDDYRYLTVVSQFRDLITFLPPTAVVTAAEARGLSVQPIRDGWGPTNLDRYLIRINKLPKDPQSGVVFSEQGFFEHVRKNFPKFLQPFPRTGKPESLAPFSTGDATSWNSNAPLGSVLEFTIDVPISPDLVAPLLPELGIVLCTEYSSNPGRDHHWNFSTVTGPLPAGNHPVSGTRQFGLRTGEGYWLFYSRAADRLGRFLEWTQAESVYEGQDVYWKYFQAELRKFVTDNDGEAEIPDGFAERFDWDRVQRIVWRAAGTLG